MFRILMVITFLFVHHTFAITLQLTQHDKYTKYNTKEFIEYSIAEQIDENIDDLKHKKWSKSKKSFNTLTYANHAYWARLKIHNLSNQTLHYYLKAENQFTYKIDYYLVKNEKILAHISDGVTSRNHNREFNTNHMLFPLLIQPNSKMTVYFKIQNYNKIDIDFTLVTKEYLLDYYQSYNILEGIFFGGMILMMLYNFFLYFLLDNRAYIYYVAYVLSLSLYFLSIFGFSERYFSDYCYLFYLSSGSLFIFLTLFVQSILGLKEKLPKIHKVLNFFIFYFILTTIINIYVLEIKSFYYAQLLFNIFFTMVFIFITIIIMSTYYLALVKKDSIAKFYAIVWSTIAFIGILLPLQYLNLIKLEISSDYIFQFLMLVEVLLFSFILAYKINLIEKEKKEQEHMLVQQNKLASMGEVIGMIAHQWRQPLCEINGIILSMDIDYQKQELKKQKFTSYLDELEKTTEYMSQTVNDFIDYFQHNKAKEEFTIDELIQGALNLVSSSNQKNIPITYTKYPTITLYAYRSELIQSLLIVINNAIDACSSLANSTIPEINISIEKNDEYIVISVQDNGGGIANEIIEKIYDPYFTTKHKSKGTGLGLYILKMIIEQTMQGKIEISSSNKITRCNILIPASVTFSNTI